MISENKEYQNLINSLSFLITKTKKDFYVNANSALTLLFWNVGKRILNHTLQEKRAEYGKETIITVSQELVSKFGKNYEEKNLRRMIQFVKVFDDYQKVVTLSRHLSWSHFITLLPIKNDIARDFYAKLSSENLFGVRDLRKSIKNKTFERTENANLQIYANIELEKNIFKDPYFLDFLELKEGYLEEDLESAILGELQGFILELGNGFSFIERQKRMIIDGDDYYLDLLFYHRKLKRLVAIELKIDKFKAKYKGQMELYLKWLNKYERQDGEKHPIGLILCAMTSSEQVELLEMHKDGIVVSEYWTELPPKDILETKLHNALIKARERIDRRNLKK